MHLGQVVYDSSSRTSHLIEISAIKDFRCQVIENSVEDEYLQHRYIWLAIYLCRGLVEKKVGYILV